MGTPRRYTADEINEWASSELPLAYAKLPPWWCFEFADADYGDEYHTKRIKIGSIRKKGTDLWVWACLKHPYLIKYFEDGQSVSLSRKERQRIRFDYPFGDLREPGKMIERDLVATLVTYYFIDEGSLPYFEEMERDIGTVTLQLLHRACDLHAYACDAREEALSRKRGDDNESNSNSIKEGKAKTVRKRQVEDITEEEPEGRKRLRADTADMSEEAEQDDGDKQDDTDKKDSAVKQDRAARKYRLIMRACNALCNMVPPADRPRADELKNIIDTLVSEDV